ncbi:hypothetical protein BDY19DRAFT_991750 [Irpex rosettiformis]|uniref:Uncharacterized protein n=1 Tax=Irpex rosettiformis TaxID=378272 RepID=A0ACB8U9V3_9APHY|nr:hypothetical protein BDY19DRAFT_991750 [Irpex rosettiformis]
MDTPDYNYSSLSELESLSDSDWLDISSRGDEDSVVGFDSDHEDLYSRPVSRRSFSSAASSRDEVVVGWEGLIEDSSDETSSVGPDATHVLASAVAEVDHTHEPSYPPEQEDDSDDERVKAALDQSMMSTLSSPRSNSLSNSVQTSIVHSTRSLRLSFPDPTTSRIQSLHTSFENLSAAEADVSLTDAVVEDTLSPADFAAEPDHISTSDIPEAKAHNEELICGPPKTLKVDFHVVLYGSSPVAKFALAEMLLDKWARSCNLIRGQKYVHAANTVMHEYDCFTSGSSSTKKFVSVTDKTGPDNSSFYLELSAPSIALVFLPSFSDISLPEHTVYLPIIMTHTPSLVDTLEPTDYLLEAEQQWEAQGITSSQLTPFSQHRSPVVEQETLEKATVQQVGQAFRPLFPASAKGATPKVSANALTIFAILSIVLGYVVHGSLNGSVVSIMANRTVTTPLPSLLRPSLSVANKSQPTALITVASSNLALSTTSLKNVAIAALNSSPTPIVASSTATPVPSSSSLSSSAPRAPSSAPQECGCGCGLFMWPGKTETTDIILRPTGSGLTARMETVTSISVVSPPFQFTSKGKGKAKATLDDTSLYSLSIRLSTALSEYLEYTPLGKVAQQDLQEIFDAIDQLSSAISRQTAKIWEQSKGRVFHIQEKLEKRNKRARHKAKRIRSAGKRWISSVKETIKTHTDLAKVNAKAITEQLVEHIEARHQRSKANAKTHARKTRKQRRAERRERRAERKISGTRARVEVTA